MSDGTRDTADPAGGAVYRPDELVVEGRRDSRVGAVVRAWDEAPPVLYRLAGAGSEPPWFAWEYDLRPATDAEAAAYRQAGPRAGELPERPRA